MFLFFRFFFFFSATATTKIYTLSLHDALPISPSREWNWPRPGGFLSGEIRRSSRTDRRRRVGFCSRGAPSFFSSRSEEHTSELQSQSNLVCRLLLEKKKKKKNVK